MKKSTLAFCMGPYILKAAGVGPTPYYGWLNETCGKLGDDFNYLASPENLQIQSDLQDLGYDRVFGSQLSGETAIENLHAAQEKEQNGS